MLHGRVQGRGFRLTVRVAGDPATTRTALRIEVTDARGDRLPDAPSVAVPPFAEDGESGRGLLLVDALADRWGVAPGPVPCKTVWAETDLAPAGGDRP